MLYLDWGWPDRAENINRMSACLDLNIAVQGTVEESGRLGEWVVCGTDYWLTDFWLKYLTRELAEDVNIQLF